MSQKVLLHVVFQNKQTKTKLWGSAWIPDLASIVVPHITVWLAQQSVRLKVIWDQNDLPEAGKGGNPLKHLESHLSVTESADDLLNHTHGPTAVIGP